MTSILSFSLKKMLPDLEEEEWKVLKAVRGRSQEEQARWTQLQKRRKALKMCVRTQNLTDEQREQKNRWKSEARANATAECKLADAQRKRAKREESRRRGEENQAPPNGLLHLDSSQPNWPPLTPLHPENQARQTGGDREAQHRPGQNLGGGSGDAMVSSCDFLPVCNTSSTSSCTRITCSPCPPSPLSSSSSLKPSLWSSSSSSRLSCRGRTLRMCT
jgi:hypothetical protein